MLIGLESEKLWVDNHPEYYKSTLHQEQVKKNIEMRYRLAKLLSKLSKALLNTGGGRL